MYGEILQAVRSLAMTYANPYTTIDHGSMPKDDGLAIYLSAGASFTRNLDRGGVYDVDIVLNGKHQNLQIVLEAMSNIHKELTTATDYPKTDNWQIMSIETTSAPNYLGREDSATKQWLYGSILRVNFYVKGVC